MNRKFSRRYAPDERDNKFRLQRLTTERTQRYWRDEWDGDQGNEPACVGYAATGWLSAQPIHQWLDPLGLYRIATLFDEWPNETWENSEGTSVRAAMKVLKHLGFVNEYRWETTVQALLPHLLEKSPIILGTVWYEGMCEPDAKGKITVSGAPCGGHAYLWTGANVKKGMARIKNSWGNSWGINGHAFLTFAELDRLLAENGEACAGIELESKQ